MSNAQTFLEIDTDKELEAMMKRLATLQQSLGAPSLLKNAINAAARKVQKELVKGVKEEYALTDQTGLKSQSEGKPQVRNASNSSLTATILSRGPMQDIMRYMTQPNTETAAAAAQILNEGGLKPLEIGSIKAFVAKLPTGHVAIMQRKGKARLPIKKLLSPAIPLAMGSESVTEPVQAQAYELLQAEITKRIDKLLER